MTASVGLRSTLTCPACGAVLKPKTVDAAGVTNPVTYYLAFHWTL